MSTDPAVPIAKGYYAEAAIMGVTCAILWGFMITQMLVYRFTPRRRWVGTKTNMLVCGFVALTLQTIRCPDLSSVFGIYTVSAEHGIHSQITASLLDSCAVMLLSNAQSLFTQIQRRAPRWYLPFLVLPPICYHITSILFGILEHIRYDELTDPDHFPKNPDPLMNAHFGKRVCFDVFALFFLSINNVLFYELYKRVSAFAKTMLQHKELKERNAPSQNARLARTTSIASAVGAGGGPGTAVAPVSVVAPTSQNRDHVLAIQVDGTGTAAATGMEPEDTQNNNINVIDLNNLSPNAAAAAAGGAGAIATATEPDTPNESPKGSPQVQQQMSPISPMNDGDLPPLEGIRRHSNTVSAISPTIKGTHRLSSGLTNMQQQNPSPTVRSMPGRPPSPSGVATIHGALHNAEQQQQSTAITTAAATTTTSAATAAASRSDALQAALRKMRSMMLLMNVGLIAAVCADIPLWSKYLKKTYTLTDVLPPDPTKWAFFAFAPIALQQVMIFVLIWYTWSSLECWSSAEVRAARGTPFWYTIRYGVQEDGTAGGGGKSVMSKKYQLNDTRVGGGTAVGTAIAATNDAIERSTNEPDAPTSKIGAGTVVQTQPLLRTASKAWS